MLEIKVISSPQEVENLERIEIGYQLWGTKDMPKTTVQIGYLLNDGFYVKLECMEKNPRRTFTKHNSPVCLDSAMEIFLQVPEYSLEYMNFEVNANGTILAEYGPQRHGRVRYDEEQIASMNCRTELLEDRWIAWYRIPKELMRCICETMELNKGSTFKINFFKVCEGRTPGEYGSYADIPLLHPSFHEPQFFVSAVLV